MRLLFWLVVAMTGTVAGATVYEAAMSGLTGGVVVGFALSVSGIWILVAVDRVIRE